MIEHWTTAYLSGANASFQRAAREYAEEYAAMAVAAERERCCRVVAVQSDDDRYGAARGTILAIRAGDDFFEVGDCDGLLKA